MVQAWNWYKMPAGTTTYLHTNPVSSNYNTSYKTNPLIFIRCTKLCNSYSVQHLHTYRISWNFLLYSSISLCVYSFSINFVATQSSYRIDCTFNYRCVSQLPHKTGNSYTTLKVFCSWINRIKGGSIVPVLLIPRPAPHIVIIIVIVIIVARVQRIYQSP